MSREDLGFEPTECDCSHCRRHCFDRPGYLIPADLERLMPRDAAPFTWAETYLRASPGAIVANSLTGRQKRIRTLVPARLGRLVETTIGPRIFRPCVWFTGQQQCSVHADAPVGCRYFDHATSEREWQARSRLFLAAVEVAWAESISEPGLYVRLWHHLDVLGLRADDPAMPPT
jgi:Fe-S-cluster containining protein